MYYKRLSSIYNDCDLKDLFPEISLGSFDAFIRKQVKSSNGFISPYKFSSEMGLSINKSVKFFIYFTGDNGIFDILYYFECSRPSCHDNRIYFDPNDLSDGLICEECGKIYELNTVKRYIKVLFKLKSDLNLPDQKQEFERKDHNSTFEALRDLPPYLKVDSPSSPANSLAYSDEGENHVNTDGVDVNIVFEENQNNEGDPISQDVENFFNSIISKEKQLK